MFRRTAADIQRAAEMVAVHPADYVVDRFVIEGIPRLRAEWLVLRARQERRVARSNRFSYFATAFGVLALIAGILIALVGGSETPAMIGLSVFALCTLILVGVLHDPARAHGASRQLDWDSRGIVPEELAAAPPRNVRIATTATLPVVVFLLVGAGTLLTGVWQVFGIWTLRHRGIETQGRVTAGKLSPPYTVIRYRYATPVGSIRDSSIVPWSVFRRLENGQTIVVTYAGSPWFMSRPFSRVELVPLLAAKIAALQIVGGLFLIAFSPYFLRVAGRQNRIDLQLAINGSVAIGEVLAVRMPFFRVRYRFRAGDRDIETEASLRRSPGVAPKTGDRIVIVYDPLDPTRNAPADALNVEFA